MRTVLCVVGVLAIAASAMGQGLIFQENYDSQTVNQPPGDPWFGILDGGVWVEDAGKQRSAPYSLMINNSGFGGADKGSSALLDGGTAWGGNDACPLVLDYWVYYGSSAQQKEADYYVELSLGDVHAPPLPDSLGSQVPPAEASPVLAYCKPWNTGDGNKKNLFYFDGKIWKKVGFTTSGWRQVVMAVNSATCDLQDGTGSGGNIAREYTGMFDRISIYTINYKKSSYTSIDDVSVTDGYTILTPPLNMLPDDEPNLFTVIRKTTSKARLPMTLYGTAELPVADIDLNSVAIANAIVPVKIKIVEDQNGDGLDDLNMQFYRRDLIDALGLDLLEPGAEVEVTVDAVAGCNLVAATDVIVLNFQGD